MGRRCGGLGGLAPARGLFPQGVRPPFSFWQRQKENAPRPVEEKKRFDALRHVRASALTGVGVPVPAPISPVLRARYDLLRGRDCRPVAEGAEVVGVQDRI